MTKSFKMVLLKGMIENGIQNPASVDYLRKYFVAEAALNPFLSFELGNRLDSQSDLESCLIDNPINAWLSRLDSADNSFFVFNDNGLRLNIELPKRLVQYFTSYISELVDYRLARYWPLTRNPELWHKYTTDQIKLLYKSINSPGNWMSGYIRLDEHKLLLVTLDKGNRVVENLNYSDKILDKDVLQWESPSGTTNKSKEGVSIIKKDLKPFHLYVRETKTRGSLTQPYVFCGEVELQKHHSQEPIRCEFKLKNSLPADLFSRFKRASEHV
jgi:hypothetical protein